LASRWWWLGIVATLILVCSSLGFYLFARDPNSEHEIRQLIDSAYNSRRPGGGRLSAAAYTPAGQSSAASAGLGRAQILLLRQPDSEVRQRLQRLIHLAAGEWQPFVDSVNATSTELPPDPATLNNLGASFLALSGRDPALLLNALETFETAAELDPKAPEPLFNLVITYRRLHFPRRAAEYLDRYSALDSSSPWHTELSNSNSIDEASILEELEQTVTTNNLDEAERLFRRNPELSRRAAMQFALANQPVAPALVRFIADRMESQYRDKTVSAMVGPLFTERREVTRAVRELVNQGASQYQEGNYPESLALYSEADRLVGKTDSVFDRLWIDLNRADAQIRLGQFDAVRRSLARIVALSQEHGLLWLKAKTQTLYGSTRKVTSSYDEMQSLLSAANDGFIRLDAPSDRVRILYYLASYRHFGGDEEEALRLALECLQLVHEADVFRISTLDTLIGSILHRRGMPEKSLLFAKESADQDHGGSYASGIGLLASFTLAELYQSMSQHDAADEYVRLAEEALQRVPEGFDHTRFEMMLGLVRAKAKVGQNKYDDAESLLQNNLAIYSQQPFPATALLSQSLMLAGQVYSHTGRATQAARKFNEAIDVIENDDEYLKSEGFRVKFDNERRQSYDSAIEFAFKNGSNDSAWTYLQKYRAKLFLEFLAAFNPNIQPIRARLDRPALQARIPKDTQILEYAFLKDRLLIWFVTNESFVVRSVPVTASQIENKVQKVLQKLRIEDEVDQLLTDLEQLLIAPVRDLLDANRTLTIIPDRALHGLPFGALKQSAGGHYLIQDFPIVVSPSLTHFLSSSTAQPARDAIVGFGSQNGGSSEFKELSALSEMYAKADTFTGRQVDKQLFLERLTKAPVFHYAGHSATDAADPLRSSILLDGERLGPNSVTAIDISRLRLANNAVVILSSCDSSVGNSRDGVGVRGLTSAFLIGGAGSVVGSLWPVEASSTADLMIRFHRSFAKAGMPVAKALRDAQLSFLKAFPERSNPYYWSGFVVTGNFSALR
jgi:CHAT domain-containing protein